MQDRLLYERIFDLEKQVAFLMKLCRVTQYQIDHAEELEAMKRDFDEAHQGY